LLESRKREFICKGILQQEEEPILEQHPLVVQVPKQPSKRLSQEQFIKFMTLLVLLMALASRLGH
jgi:hypothetical protein